jgi:hypothetical protein
MVGSVYRASSHFIPFKPVSGKEIKFVYCDQVLKVVYLNSQSQIIEVEDLFEGTTSASAVYP